MIAVNNKEKNTNLRRSFNDSIVLMNPNFNASNNDIFNLDNTAIIHCHSSRKGTYIIPETVICIGVEAFAHCKTLTSIVIPSSVKVIGFHAFCNCKGLQSIVSQSKNPIYLAPNTEIFDNVDKINCVLYVPEGSKQLYQQAEQWNQFVNMQELTDFGPNNISDINHNYTKIAI